MQDIAKWIDAKKGYSFALLRSAAICLPVLALSGCMGAGLVEATRAVPIHIPPAIAEKTELLVPLAKLGIHNFFASVRVTIDRKAA